MIGSLFNDIGRRNEGGGGGENGGEKSGRPGGDREAAVAPAAAADDALLSAIPVVARIARRRAAGRPSWQDEAADLVQRVITKLVAWRERNRAKSAEMSPDDWRALAARSAFNEANRPVATRRENVPLEDVPSSAAADLDVDAVVEGNTDAEVLSLASTMWREMTAFSVRQRRALLLGSAELILTFMQCGVGESELMEALGMDRDEWTLVVGRLPLTDGDIGELKVPGPGGKPSTADSIKKARFEARKKLKEVTRK